SVLQTFYSHLDAGTSTGSLASWHRIARQYLEAQRPIRRRKNHRSLAKPQFITTRPMQAWTWDITHLPGPYTQVRYHFYVAIDVFSRAIVAWRVERSEDGELARDMFQEALLTHRGRPEIVHSDGGAA